MSTTTEEPRVIAKCSFCLKTNLQVQKLVAGPGVFICDECVALCNQVIATELDPDRPKTESPVAPWEVDIPLDKLLASLSKIAEAQTQAEENLRLWVTKARSNGATWKQLGEALGMTRQSAWERFSGEE